MKETSKHTISHEDFHRWLADGESPLIVKCGSNETATVLKLAKTENIDYLFGASSLYTETISWSDRLEFCGMYNRISQRLVLAGDPLTTLVDGLTEEETQEGEVLTKEASALVNRRVERVIGNDRNKLSAKEIASPWLSRDLADYLEYGAKRDTVQALFEGTEPDGKFYCDSADVILQEDAFVRWFQDPDSFIQAEAEQYIESHQEILLMNFLKSDALLKEYQAVMRDTGSPVHRKKAISDAVTASGAKTVTVTVRKDDRELAFKTSASSLTGLNAGYSRYDIAAPDRREFERLFGKYEDFGPEDVVKITYGKRTLYEAQAAQTEDWAPVEGEDSSFPEAHGGMKIGGMRL